MRTSRSGEGLPYFITAILRTQFSYSKKIDVKYHIIFQSDVEKLEGLPVAPFMDREKVSKPSAQIGFIKFVLLPLFESLGTLFPVIQVLHFVKLFHIYMHSLNFNNENAEWKCLIPDYFVRMKIKSIHDS